MTNRSCSFLFIIFLTGCATAPANGPRDIAPAPQMAKDLETELAKVVSPSHCRILGCVNLKRDPNHFICKGEFSLINSSIAQENFRTAANKIISRNIQIDFTADEGFGSQMLAAFLGGVGGGLAAGATKGGAGPSYAGGKSSAAVRFTLPEIK